MAAASSMYGSIMSDSRHRHVTSRFPGILLDKPKHLHCLPNHQASRTRLKGDSDATLKAVREKLTYFRERTASFRHSYREKSFRQLCRMLEELPYFSRQITHVTSVGFLKKVLEVELGLSRGARESKDQHLRILINFLDIVTYFGALKNVFFTKVFLPLKKLTLKSSARRMRNKHSGTRRKVPGSCGQVKLGEVKTRTFEVSSKISDPEGDNKVCSRIGKLLEQWQELLSDEKLWVISASVKASDERPYANKASLLGFLIPQVLRTCHQLATLAETWLADHERELALQLERRVLNLHQTHKDWWRKSMTMKSEIDASREEVEASAQLLSRLDMKSNHVQALFKKHQEAEARVISLRDTLKLADSKHDNIINKMGKFKRQPPETRDILKTQLRVSKLYRHIVLGNMRVAQYDRRVTGQDMKLYRKLKPILQEYKADVEEQHHLLQQRLAIKTSALNDLERKMQQLKEEKWKMQEEWLRRSMTDD